VSGMRVGICLTLSRCPRRCTSPRRRFSSIACKYLLTFFWNRQVIKSLVQACQGTPDLEAVRISTIRTRRVSGVEEITHLGGMQRGSTRWFTIDEIFAAIENGERFFIQSGAESMLLSVQTNGAGKKTLAVGFEPGPARLLTLPRDSG